MKILLNTSLPDDQLALIRAVSPSVEVLLPGDRQKALDLMPEVEVVFGGFSREMFVRGEKLRWVQVESAGVDGILFREFVESDVILTSSKGHVGIALAEQALALLLALTRGVAYSFRHPTWSSGGPIRRRMWELTDMTMGILGLGGTGVELAKRACAFGMRVIALDPEDMTPPPGVEAVYKMDRLNDLLSESDVVAVCAPLTPQTEGLLDLDAFRQMKRTALLINVTRGRIVDGDALMQALEQRLIAGAGLDVVPWEPLPDDHPLWRMENVVITPHVAGGSPHRVRRNVALFCENLRRLLTGQPLTSVIDKRKGY
jgi:phosphoglycerate dehydrogenase-like enzyme